MQPPFYSRNKTEMYEKTLNKPLEFLAKENASEAAIDILQKVTHQVTVIYRRNLRGTRGTGIQLFGLGYRTPTFQDTGEEFAVTCCQ